MEIGFAILAVVLGLVSYAFLTGRRAPAEGFSPQLVTLLLVANLLPLLALLLLIARRVAILMANRRARVAGAQMHVRLIGLFATLAAVPTILTVIFASLLFQYGVQFWFSDRARTVLDNADQVARAYVDDATVRIRDDIVAMGSDVSDYAHGVGLPRGATFRDGVVAQLQGRTLSDAMVFRPEPEGLVSVAAVGMDEGSLPAKLGDVDLAAIPAGQAVLLGSAHDRIEAVVRLQTAAPMYLYVSRRVEPRVLEQVARTEAAITDYKALTDRSQALQWRFNLMLLVVSLLIIAAAVWFAILLATRIVSPIGELADAAERIGMGDLDARVKVPGGSGEISQLGRAFNRMTGDLKAQQAALIDANTRSETGRRIIEAVLSGVSAGVLSI
ncbi:MAG: HAMP domain-containing protein, partial [Sphingomonadaceae bacterium]